MAAPVEATNTQDPLGSDEDIETLLRLPYVAVIGISQNSSRDAYHIAEQLQSKGYRIMGINPTIPAGETILGGPVYADLSKVPEGTRVDWVDVFRRNEFIPAIIDHIIEHRERLGIKGIWLQSGLRNDEYAAKARATGLIVVQDACAGVMRSMRGDGAYPDPALV